MCNDLTFRIPERFKISAWASSGGLRIDLLRRRWNGLYSIVGTFESYGELKEWLADHEYL